MISGEGSLLEFGNRFYYGSWVDFKKIQKEHNLMERS